MATINTAGSVEDRTVWDPVRGKIAFRRAEFEAPTNRIVLPGWVGSLGLLLAIVGMGALVWGALTGGARSLGLGASLLLLGVAAGVLREVLGKRKAYRLALLSALAKRNDWAFEPVAKTHADMKHVAEESGLPTVMRGDEWIEPRVAALYDRIPELMRGTRAAMFEAFYWGTLRTRDGDLPFWLGLEMMDYDATLGTSSTRKDAKGRHGVRGQYISLCTAYDLDRDTMIRVAITTEGRSGDGRDLDTESAEFNEAFRIRPDEGARGDPAAVLRTLTPAFQTTLLDLKARYDAQAVIDGPTLWLSGSDRIASEDETVIAAAMNDLVRAFARAATGLKRYAE